MFVKYSDIYSRCRCSKFHWLKAPPTLSLERGLFLKKFCCIRHCAWEGDRAFFAGCTFAERPSPRAHRAVQQRALTLYGTATAAPHRWPALGSHSSPLCCTTIPHKFYSNSLRITARKLRGKKLPRFLCSGLWNLLTHNLRVSGTIPVGLNQGAKGTNPWRASQQAERVGFGHQRSKEPKMFLKLPGAEARIFLRQQ